jgi:hypothetical protein
MGRNLRGEDSFGKDCREEDFRIIGRLHFPIILKSSSLQSSTVNYFVNSMFIRIQGMETFS